MAKNKKFEVKGIEITIAEYPEGDFICLTDIAKFDKNESRAIDVIKNWLRLRSTIEYLGAWEAMHNPNFKVVEFDHFRNSSGSNSFVLSPQLWIEKTNAIGIRSKSGRYGGTYAHKDIAFDFVTWLSPIFRLYVVKEYQRLKALESNAYNLEWSIKRTLAKVNYTLHTDAIKDYIIPERKYKIESFVYAEEADLLNVAVFGFTANQWREANPKAHLEGKNMRDIASINELTVLSNLESLNSIMIKQKISIEDRFEFLRQEAREQLKSLNQTDFVKSLKYTSDSTYPLALEEGENLSDFNKNLKKAIENKPERK